ncbi:hypothetical protein [Pseudomonas syringae]|uniref:hypothetical protein n=1 Tax=Pseudomonas syringae TaxID=317 RepID=UPI00200A4DE4|nr:hypothetical protein [Pseudomonas syringae]MCK9709851.1 hypothetical protein [Pseudomonas syringae pv. syringae]
MNDVSEEQQSAEVNLIKDFDRAHMMLMGICGILPFLYWIGVINTGPLEWWQAVSAVSKPDAVADRSIFELGGVFASFAAYMVGGFGWLGISGACVWPFKRRLMAFFMGSEKALDTAERQQYEAATTPIPRGQLVDVKLLPGGFLGSDQSVMSTTQGLFRVLGVVSDVAQGATVTELNGYMHVEASNGFAAKSYRRLGRS